MFFSDWMFSDSRFLFFIPFSLGFYTKKVPSLHVTVWLIPEGKLTLDTLRPALLATPGSLPTARIV